MKQKSIWSIVALIMIIACSEDDKDTKIKGSKLYEVSSNWNCVGGSCQDVYDFKFAKDAKVTFDASNITDGSVVQLALYGPEVALGGINLFTGTDSEIGCKTSGCDNNTQGYAVTDFSIPTAGTYRLAVTRNHGASCGSSGDYDLSVTADKSFEFKEQSVDNLTPLAPDDATQVCD